MPDRRAGELYIGGLRVGRGYLGRPEQTAGELRPRPVLRRSRRPALSDGGPGALAGRRRPRVPGPQRPAGEGAGLPDRARRGRVGPRAVLRRVQAVAVLADPRQLAAYLVGRAGGSRPPPTSSAASAPPAARLHGPVGFRLPRGAAADAQRQGGPASAGAARSGGGAGGVPGAAHRRRRGRWRGCGRELLGIERVGAFATTSSISEGTRCSRPRWSPESGAPSASSSRSAACSKRRRSKGWPAGWRCPGGAGRRGCRGAAVVRAAGERCGAAALLRPGSGSGSSISWSRVRSTTSRLLFRVAGRIDVVALAGCSGGDRQPARSPPDPFPPRRRRAGPGDVSSGEPLPASSCR